MKEYFLGVICEAGTFLFITLNSSPYVANFKARESGGDMIETSGSAKVSVF
jgi:hypothetical protein